jgi:hypothetical protein
MGATGMSVTGVSVTGVSVTGVTGVRAMLVVCSYQ